LVLLDGRRAESPLGAGGLRVDDPAGREHPEEPGHADLAGHRVDAHLRELGAERVACERFVGLDVAGRVDADLAPAAPA